MAETSTELDRIYAEHYPRILRYLTRLLGAEEAKDLAQEVFIKASRGWSGFHGESQGSTWLFRIATHAAVDRRREASFRREMPMIAVGAPCGKTSGSSLEDSALRKATNDCIRDVIDGLPEKYRIPLMLCELEGFTNREIAEILGVSLATVKIRLHRAKAQLKEALLQACEFSRDERNELTCDPIKS